MAEPGDVLKSRRNSQRVARPVVSQLCPPTLSQKGESRCRLEPGVGMTGSCSQLPFSNCCVQAPPRPGIGGSGLPLLKQSLSGLLRQAAPRSLWACGLFLPLGQMTGAHPASQVMSHAKQNILPGIHPPTLTCEGFCTVNIMLTLRASQLK